MELFEKLINANFCSGEEKGARELITEAFSPFADKIYTDKCGNLITVFGNDTGEDTENTAVFAPMDVPGLVVTYIEENGAVRVSPLGSSDYRSALYHTVTDGKINGILYPDSADCSGFASTHANFGFKDRNEAESHLSQGTVLFFKKAPESIENGIFAGVGIGSASCVQAVLSAAKELKKADGRCIYLVFTAQSALYNRGAYQAAYGINPTKALSVDLFEGKDISVKILDKSVVCDEKLTILLEEAAKDCDIPVKRYVSSEETSDAAKIQSAFNGVKTASLLIPVNHKGSLMELVATDSILSAGKIIARFLNSI